MMELIDGDDWACFIDGDAVHTSHYFGARIEQTILKNPEYSLFTCYTNRIGCKYQIAPNVHWDNNDQEYHRNIGENLWATNGTSIMDITKNSPMSGVMILISKSIWEKVGGFKEEKMLAIDNDIHLKVKQIGGKVGLMKGIYLQHWYRGGKGGIKHLL
jgi:GT2 family glycosyltransferase